MLFFLFWYIFRWAVESINIACKWGYKGVESGTTLSGMQSPHNYQSQFIIMDSFLFCQSITIYSMLDLVTEGTTQSLLV